MQDQDFQAHSFSPTYSMNFTGHFMSTYYMPGLALGTLCEWDTTPDPMVLSFQ